MSQPRVALTIAGSDSSGGAGIQADLKTFAALGVFGTSAITAITAQNTTGVRAIHAIPPAVIGAQVDAVCEDFDVVAVKTGMLGDAATMIAVADALQRWPQANLVVDPVMVAESGARLMEEVAIEVLRQRMVPLARVLTPNVPEAEVLLGRAIGGRNEDLLEAARQIQALGCAAVLIKGGHRAGDADDVLLDGDRALTLHARRIDSTSTHGTGCTLGAAIAAFLARGRELEEAVASAKEYVSEGIRTARPLGHGSGPLHHFHEFYGAEGLP